MISVRTAHTAQLDPATLAEARSLLYAVFDDMTEDDWEHCLGGIHALAYEGGELAGHAAVVQRRLLHGGRALRAGYVEGVGVRAEYRRRGHASAMMEALERVIRDAYDLGALGATDEAVAALLGPRLAAVGRAAVGADARRRAPDARGGGRGLRAAGRGRRARPVARADLRLARRRRLVIR